MKSLPGTIVGEQQQDLGLDRIGVLEFVDEDARELRRCRWRAHAWSSP